MLNKKILIACLALALILAQAAALFAQGGIVAYGDTVTGVLTAEDLVHYYVFEGFTGDAVSFNVEFTAVNVTVVVGAPDGTVVLKEKIAERPAMLDATGLILTATGPHTITLFAPTNIGANVEINYQLTLTATEAPRDGAAATPDEETAAPTEQAAETPEATPQTLPAAGPVTLDGGPIRVTLAWETSADLNLEVRDPEDGDIYFAQRTSPSGGSLTRNANADCETFDESPTEAINWAQGREVPAGSYEIMVHHLYTCDDPGATEFTLTVEVNGTTISEVISSVPEGETYITSFELAGDGTADMNAGGIADALNLSGIIDEVLAPATIQTGETVQNTITNQNPANAYAFDANEGDALNIVLTHDRALGGNLDTLLMLLDPVGDVYAWNDDTAEGTTNSALRGLELDQTGTYTVVATRYGLNLGGTTGTYSLNLNVVPSTLAAEPETETGLGRGDIEVTLRWSTDDDLQLLVRDPLGDAVYDDDTEILSGGTLDANGNVNCEDTTTSPVSHIYWPEGTLRTGTYEVEVWYQNACATQETVTMLLTINVNGQTLDQVTQRMEEGQFYLTSFTVSEGGLVENHGGGILAGLDATIVTENLATALPITYGETVNGSITLANRYQLYTFQGSRDDVVTLSMDQQSGNLDPQLFLTTAQGVPIASNDDAVVNENTNSLITEVTLPSDGTYVIVATHYGVQYGGTTGSYLLSLSARVATPIEDIGQ